MKEAAVRMKVTTKVKGKEPAATKVKKMRRKQVQGLAGEIKVYTAYTRQGNRISNL